MDKRIKKIVYAVNSVLFSMGYNREQKMHSLGYWEESTKRRCTICLDDPPAQWETANYYCLNTVKRNDTWYLRLYYSCYNDYLDKRNEHELLLIPLDTDRLCWEQATDAIDLIDHRIAVYEGEV